MTQYNRSLRFAIPITSSTFNNSSTRREFLDSLILIVTSRKQSFIIGRLYSKRPIFTVTMRVKSSSPGWHAVIWLSSYWLGGARGLRTRTIWPVAGQRAILGIDEGQVIIGSRLPKIFDYLLNHLATRKSIFIEVKLVEMIREIPTKKWSNVRT